MDSLQSRKEHATEYAGYGWPVAPIYSVSETAIVQSAANRAW